MKVAVCEYGAGNVRSVLAAFARLDADVCIADTAAAVAAADLAVLPGVGSAASAMAVLRERGLDDPAAVERELRDRHDAAQSSS